jgi:hypothetical protein
MQKLTFSTLAICWVLTSAACAEAAEEAQELCM